MGELMDCVCMCSSGFSGLVVAGNGNMVLIVESFTLIRVSVYFCVNA